MSAAPLSATVVVRERLGETEIARMLALMDLCYEGVDAARFRADLRQKQEVILLRVKHTGELVGFSTIRRSAERFDGRMVEVIFSGDTVLHPAHWGAKTLQAAFSRFALRRKLSQPLRPVFWFLLSGGYKTYLLMVRNLPRAWPRPASAAPPTWRPFVDDLAGRWFGGEYDAGRGIVRFAGPHYRVRAGIAPIDRDAARVPEIAFFAEKNPGHAAGDELVCLAELRLRDLVRVLARALRGRVRAPLKGARGLFAWRRT
ncbi:MAG: hypothetical protein ABUS79_12745 [Pseudomonadota bacterium]